MHCTALHCNAVLTMAQRIGCHLGKHGSAYLTAAAIALSASLTAYYDNFGGLTAEQVAALGWWQVLALGAKVLNPGVVALVGYLMKSPLSKNPEVKPLALTHEVVER